MRSKLANRSREDATGPRIDRLGGEVDTDALEDYIAPSLTGAPVAPPALDRIDVTP
jgi:hypothetical protein